MSTADLSALWPALCRQRPQAGALARLVCLPVRVTPAFLRRVRLHLLPHSDTGDEADLCLSDLVETRTTAGFSLRRAVRAQLREALASDPAALQAVWQGAHQPHATWLAPRARLEEALTWHLLRERTDPASAPDITATSATTSAATAIAAAWATVLQHLDAAPDAEAWARWVLRAVPDLPAGALDTLPAQRAWYGAHLLLGDASVLGEQAQTFLASGEFSFATRRLPRRTVHVGRLADGLVVSPVLPIDNGFALSIPATRPLWLQVEVQAQAAAGPQTGAGSAAGQNSDAELGSSGAAPSSAALPAPAPQVLMLHGDARVQLATGGGPLLLRAIDGAAWRLSPPPAVADEAPAAPPPDQAPRVRLRYEAEFYGSNRPVELPFVVGVMADLSGQPAEPLPPLADRKFWEIDRDNFDDRLKAMRPRVALQVPDVLTGEGHLAVDLRIEALADFSPLAVLQRVAPLREHLARRDALPAADERRAALDARLNEQLNLVLHHGAFQWLEGAWRGLHYLVAHTRTDELLKIRVLNVGKTELTAAMLPDLVRPGDGRVGADYDVLEPRLRRIGRTAPGGDTDLRQTALFKKVHDEAFGQFGGEPFGLLVADYHFDHSIPDVLLLDALGQVAAAALAPLVTGASSSPLQIDGWQALAQAGDLVKTSATPEYLGWHALRGAAHARYIGLAMPRMLARAPWLPPADEAPDAGFRFTEDVAGAASDPVLWTNSDKHTWTNAAYAMAANIARAYSQHGWCARIRGVEGGGLVSDLPTAEMPADDGSLAQACGTEIALSDRREAELAKFGLMPLTHLKNREHAVFFSAKPLYLPGADSDGPLDSFQDALASSWPYLLTACSVMRVLKCMVRDKIGVLDDATLHQQLQAWLAGQVLGDAQASSPQQQAQRPLAAAALRFSAAPASGYLQAQLSLLPHYQLEGLGTPMQLTTLLPGMRSPA